MTSRLRASLAAALVVLVGGGLAWLDLARIAAEDAQPFDRHAAAFAGSTTCRRWAFSSAASATRSPIRRCSSC
jgi:hypothetical protein